MNISESLLGCGTALITPFDAQENVDYDSYTNLVDRQLAAGIHFLVPLGTTAETPTLTAEEKSNLLKITSQRVRQSGGNVPIVAGVGSNSTTQVFRNIDNLEGCGADAYLVVTPYYNKPTQEGLFRHFTAVADYSPKPIIMYNVPGRTGVNMTASTTIRLSAHPNIIAVKEASANYAQINAIIIGAQPGFKVFSGNDDETLSLMSSGAAGIISVASNVAPNLMVALVEAIQQSDIAAARGLHQQLSALFCNCFVESNPIPVKAALAQMGLMQNVLRLPLVPATASTEELMHQTITQLQLA